MQIKTERIYQKRNLHISESFGRPTQEEKEKKEMFSSRTGRRAKVEEMTITPPSPTANAQHSNEEKRKLEEVENCLSEGKKMDRASLEGSEMQMRGHSDKKKRELEKVEKKLAQGGENGTCITTAE